jgi:hypothetical protein
MSKSTDEALAALEALLAELPIEQREAALAVAEHYGDLRADDALGSLR